MAAADTNRATEADDDETVESGTSSLPTAVVVPPRGEAPAIADPFRWIRRGSVLAALALGWTLILYFNRFNLSAPTVFVCLAYLAVVSTAYALWRTGMVVVVEDDEEADSTWGRPIGRRTELDREKKTLLKAIKEAEFDREMGKLSKVDAEEMIAVYRVRAIEVIKEIDQMDAGTAGTVREQIERELKARLEIETRADKAKRDALADATKDKKKKEAAKADKSLAKKAVAAAMAAPGGKVSVSVDSATGTIDVKSEDVKNETAKSETAKSETDASPPDASSDTSNVDSKSEAAKEASS